MCSSTTGRFWGRGRAAGREAAAGGAGGHTGNDLLQIQGPAWSAPTPCTSTLACPGAITRAASSSRSRSPGRTSPTFPTSRSCCTTWRTPSAGPAPGAGAVRAPPCQRQAPQAAGARPGAAGEPLLQVWLSQPAPGARGGAGADRADGAGRGELHDGRGQAVQLGRAGRGGGAGSGGIHLDTLGRGPARGGPHALGESGKKFTVPLSLAACAACCLVWA